MTTTLCGHERDVLIWALDELARYPFENVKLVAKSMGDDFAVTVCDADDPAKLAGLMAEELRRFGLDVATDWLDRHDFYVAWWPNNEHPTESPGIELRAGRWGRFPGDPAIEFSVPQARAALLRLMQLPEDTAAQDVLKALEVGP